MKKKVQVEASEQRVPRVKDLLPLLPGLARPLASPLAAKAPLAEGAPVRLAGFGFGGSESVASNTTEKNNI